MDNKSTPGQVEPEKWLFIGTPVAVLVGLLAPAACITIFFGQSGVFWDFLLSADYYSKYRALSYNARGRHRLLVWIRNNVMTPLAYGANLTEDDLWRDGSILCSLINLLVPEACPRPQNHCNQRPWHGQGLAHKYLGIAPIFTNEEFAQETLTPQQEQKFFKYLCTVHRTITEITSKTHSMKFSNDYVSRGMGLVIGQQCQKSTFYIYPIPKHLHQQHPSDIEVSIQGPYGCQGHIVIPSILHHKQRCQKPTDYRRSLYITSKLNSISPTTQGTSFLRILSLRASPKRVDPAQEIVIKVKLTETRAKVSYIPQATGIYTVNLLTNECHVLGSPHTVSVAHGTGKSYLSNDSDTESEEETRFVRRKKRIISRIVDFVDEKMLLQQDGTLVRNDDTKAGKSDDERVERKENGMVKNMEMSKHIVEKSKDDRFINEHELKVATIDTNSNEETSNVTEEDNEDNVEVNNIIRKEIINEKKPEIFSETQNNSAKEDNHFELTESNPIELEDKETTNSDTIEEHCLFDALNNNLLDAMDMNSLSVNYNQLEHGYKSITPDILEPSNNNSTIKLSETSTAFVDDRQTHKGKSLDPTSDSTEVQDPKSVYDIMKTFSTKDPTKEESSLVGNYMNCQRNSSVNSLIKVFDGSRNDPDLVQCHGKPNEESISYEHVSTRNEHLDEKLERMGVVLIDFDKRQRYLKSVLLNQLNRLTRKLSTAFCKYSYAVKTTSANSKTKDLDTGGVVERQKKFWQDKFTTVNSENVITKHSLKFSIRSSAKPESIRIETVSSKSSGDVRQIPVQGRSFDGLVRNTTEIFETESLSNDNINQPKTRDNEGLMQKSKSEGNIQNNMSQCLSKVDSSYQYASIEDRKAQLLKSYLDTTLSRDDNKKHIHQSRSVDQGMLQTDSDPHDQELIVSPTLVKQPDLEGTPTTSGAQKVDRTSSVRRRARFKRAKLFFHHLERSQWKTRMDLSPETESRDQLQFQRCESAPCLDRQRNYTPYEIEQEATVPDGNALPTKISKRFLVDDLFRDILGDSDNRFLGIPNKMAVVASLASLDSDSSRAEFEEGNQQQQPKRTKRRRIPSPGFHDDYPHPPMTERWMYRSRSNTDLAGLIPRCVLLGATTNHTEI